MATKDQKTAAALVPLFVVGLLLSATGVVFTSLGWARFVMMAVGVVLVLVFAVRVLRQRAGGPPA